MTNTPTHYFNFKPCEAVQWTGTEEGFDTVSEHLADQGFDIAQAGDMCQLWASDMSTEIHRLTPGQWLIRQEGKVWVQDEEPPKVERWMPGVEINDSYGHETLPLSEGYEHEATHRRPVLSNGWTGPWEGVDGGS